MRNSKEIQAERAALAKNISETEEAHKKLMADLNAKQAELGEKLLTDKTTSIKDLSKLKEEIEASDLLRGVQKVRMALLQEELNTAIEAETQAKLDRINAEVVKHHEAYVKAIYDLYKMSIELMELDAKYKFVSGQNRKSPLLGIPPQSIMDSTDRWLIMGEKSEKGLPELMAKAKIPSKAERAKDRVEGRKVMYKDV